MSAKSDPQAERERAGSESGSGSRTKFYYRRALSGRDLLPAIGAGIVGGILAFYVAQIYLQQSPLVPAGKKGAANPDGATGRARGSVPKRGG